MDLLQDFFALTSLAQNTELKKKKNVALLPSWQKIKVIQNQTKESNGIKNTPSSKDNGLQQSNCKSTLQS